MQADHKCSQALSAWDEATSPYPPSCSFNIGYICAKHVQSCMLQHVQSCAPTALQLWQSWKQESQDLLGQEEGQAAPRYVNSRAAASSSQQGGSSQSVRPYQTPTRVAWLIQAVQCKRRCKQLPTTQTTGSQYQLHSRVKQSVTPDLADGYRQAAR